MSPITRAFLASLIVAGGVAGCNSPAASPASSATPASSASPASAASSPSSAAVATAAPTPVVATDYALAQNWAQVPATVDKPVDVFYVYPTVWSKTSPSDPDVNNIDNASMHQGVAAILPMHATVFEQSANVWAPYYRQADGKTTLSMSFDQSQELIAGVPKQDVFAAFDYYIKHDNGGRPFIILAHSQGSNVVAYLLADYMKAHPDVYARMIAAYVPGYSFTDVYFAANPHLHFAQGPTDTGVVIAWNTESPQFAGQNPVMTAPGEAQVMNPITYTHGTETVPATASLGSYMPGANGLQKIADYADATLDATNGVIRCSTVDAASMTDSSGVFPLGVYHPFDISLYYYDLRANGAARIEAWQEAHRQ